VVELIEVQTIRTDRSARFLIVSMRDVVIGRIARIEFVDTCGALGVDRTKPSSLSPFRPQPVRRLFLSSVRRISQINASATDEPSVVCSGLLCARCINPGRYDKCLQFLTGTLGERP
jgi:hypothetical protein